MAQLYVTEFEVEGFGEFPLDMLRYDHCIPDTQEDVSLIARSFKQYRNRLEAPNYK
jgi:hypothetical protein